MRKLSGSRISTPRRLHPEKKGIRVIAFAESSKKKSTKSAIAAVVMRRDLVIDGMALATVTQEGDDATDTIIATYSGLDRSDIVCMMVAGVVISMYNIIDCERISAELAMPVIALTFEDSAGLEESIRRRFPDRQDKLESYRKLGARRRIVLRTGNELFLRSWGMTDRKAVSILNSFTLQGSIPEPVRVAKLAAKALSTAML